MSTIKAAVKGAGHQLWRLLNLNLHDSPALALSCVEAFSDKLQVARSRLIILDAEFQVLRSLPTDKQRSRVRHMDERIGQLYEALRHATRNVRLLLEDCLRLPATAGLQQLLGEALQELSRFVHALWSELRKWRELRLQLVDADVFRDHF